jgi:hypothetical protein
MNTIPTAHLLIKPQFRWTQFLYHIKYLHPVTEYFVGVLPDSYEPHVHTRSVFQSFLQHASILTNAHDTVPVTLLVLPPFSSPFFYHIHNYRRPTPVFYFWHSHLSAEFGSPTNTTECRGRVVNTYASCSGGPGFESRLRRDFTQPPPQANAWIIGLP